MHEAEKLFMIFICALLDFCSRRWPWADIRSFERHFKWIFNLNGSGLHYSSSKTNLQRKSATLIVRLNAHRCYTKYSRNRISQITPPMKRPRPRDPFSFPFRSESHRIQWMPNLMLAKPPMTHLRLISVSCSLRYPSRSSSRSMPETVLPAIVPRILRATANCSNKLTSATSPPTLTDWLTADYSLSSSLSISIGTKPICVICHTTLRFRLKGHHQTTTPVFILLKLARWAFQISLLTRMSFAARLTAALVGLWAYYVAATSRRCRHPFVLFLVVIMFIFCSD